MFKKICEGDVVASMRAAGSRTAILPDGKLLCSFNVNSGHGSNDFVPWFTYSEDGENWSEPKIAFDGVVGKRSVFGSVRTTLDGRVCFAGSATVITGENDSFWSGEESGMLANKLVFSVSDDGYNFPPLTEVELPYPASAEIPGGMLIDRDGTMFMLYSPYPIIGSKVATKVNCMVLMRSDDGGKTFTHTIVGEDELPCQYGEAWVVRIANDTYFISAWQTAVKVGSDRYLISGDGAKTFSKPMILPFNGQSTASEAWEDGKVFVIYNLRTEQPAGVWLAAGKPDENGFNLIANEPVWLAKSTTSNNSKGEFSDWTSFTFGEPHVLLLPDGKLLCTLWYEESEKQGIRFVKLEIE